jgi:hypothetical protein
VSVVIVLAGDVGIAAGVVVLTVWLLFTYGDSLLQ